MDVTVVSLRRDLLTRAAVDGSTLQRAAWDSKMVDSSSSSGRGSVFAARQSFLPVAAGAYGGLDSRSVRSLDALAYDSVTAASSVPAGLTPLTAPFELRRRVVAAVVLGGAAGVNRLRDRASIGSGVASSESLVGLASSLVADCVVWCHPLVA